jgi:tRNA (guanine10-N2)-dimethyltransferase
MVNLSGARPGSRFLDPFVGSGGLLIEASLVGCDTIGIDIVLEMVKGSKTNLQSLRSSWQSVCLGDARHLPIREVDAVATDPPYGRSSSTRGRETQALVEDFLGEVSTILKTGSKICLSVPSDVHVNGIASGHLKTVEEHLMRVHRSLTRKITVFSKT